MRLHILVGYIALSITFFVIPNVICRDNNNNIQEKYGPYEIEYLKLQECRGPRLKNLTKIMLNGPIIRRDGTFILFNITVPEIAKVETMRMESFNTEHNIKNFLSTFRVQRPCDHFLMGPALAMLLKTTSSCLVKPGIYVSEMDPTAFSNKIFTSMLYGNFSSKIQAYNKKGNLFCFVNYVNVRPAAAKYKH